MTARQSFVIGLIPAALLAGFLIGQRSAPKQPAEAAPSAPGAMTAPPLTVDQLQSASGAAAAVPAEAPAGAQTASAPYAGGGGADVAPDAPLSPSPDMDARIAAAEKSGDKKAISAAYTERGTARMYDENAGRKIKYKAALEDYRKALAADPKNEDAKAAADTIVGIYKSLGRPVPGS